MNAAIINHLIVKAYKSAAANEEAVCAVELNPNSPKRQAAIMEACVASSLITMYKLEKEVGMSYFNVWN